MNKQISQLLNKKSKAIREWLNNLHYNKIYPETEDINKIFSQEGKRIFEILYTRQEKGKPRMWWVKNIKSVTRLSVNDLNQLMQDRKMLHSLMNNIQEDKTDQCLIQEEDNGKPLI